MAERDEIRRRLLWRLFGTPVTLVPILGGVSAALTPVLFGIDPAVPLFVGITGIVGGVMGLALRAILGRETISQSILDELEEEQMAEFRARMKLLRRRLEDDGDARTEGLLDDLLALTDTIKNDAEWRRNVNTVVAADLMQGVDDLFDGCLRNLEHSLELARTIRKVNTPAAKQGLVDDRERVVGEITASVGELSRYLSELRVLGTEVAPEKELQRIRGDIDRSLAAARQTVRETEGWHDTDDDLRRARARAAQKQG